jgi:glycosyltransferase involved in cell wall biosynthesis
MLNILYFGNKLSGKRKIKSMLEELEPKLSEVAIVKTFSGHTNYFLKLSDVSLNFLKNFTKTNLVIIDVFSTLNAYYSLYLTFLARLLKVPYVLVLHGGNLPTAEMKKPILFKKMFLNAKALITPSGYLCEHFKTRYSNVCLIPNFVNLEDYKFSIREFDKPRILYIRGFGKVYNPTLLIEATSLLKNSIPDFQVCMMGNDQDGLLEECKNLAAKLELDNHISFKEAATKEQWIKLAEEFNIMVSTPVIDNTPVSVIEGMLLGLPVISTNVGGVPYLIDDKETGLMVPSNDAASLAESIIFLMKNSDARIAIQEAARKKAEEFSWENIRPLWEEVLKSHSRTIS